MNQVDPDLKLEQEFCHANRYWIICSILLVRTVVCVQL